MNQNWYDEEVAKLNGLAAHPKLICSILLNVRAYALETGCTVEEAVTKVEEQMRALPPKGSEFWS